MSVCEGGGWVRMKREGKEICNTSQNLQTEECQVKNNL